MELPSIIAHRGFSSRAPENTVAAINLAMESGVDMIEVDIAQSRDQIPVLFHDELLDRTSNGSGLVKKHSISRLRKLDAGSWFSKSYSNEKIPSLEEVIAMVDGRTRLLLEVKKGNTYYPNIEENIAAILKSHSAEDWCIIQSFDNNVLRTFRERFPTLTLHKLVTGNIPVVPLHIDNRIRLGNIYRYKHVSSINVNHRLLNGRKVRRIQKRGQMVYAWTVNEEEDMKRMIRIGVNGIITDYPDLLKSILNKLKTGA